jgi:guanidinopropionase
MSRDVDPFFQPIPAMELARFAGVLTFMRLPHMTPDHPRFDDINIGLLGVPWDGGTTNRPGARHGPRQMRDLSTMIRAMNPVTNISPFASVNCADLGDVPPNPVDIQDSLTGVTDFISVMKKKILCQ